MPAAEDQRLVACGAREPGNDVVRTLELGRARDYRLTFPEIPQIAELEVDAPVFLVFYDGPTLIVEARLGTQVKIMRDSPICAWFAPDRVVFIQGVRLFPVAEPVAPA
jgi:hypothetical protein